MILYLFHKFFLVEANLERQGAPKMLIRAHIMYTCTLVQTSPLQSRGAPRDKAMASFRRKCWPLVDLYLGVFDWKVQWPKATSLKCVESIYVKITETTCSSDKLLCLFKEEEEEEEDDGQIASLGYSCIKRVLQL